jgi:hypothetical protein
MAGKRRRSMRCIFCKSTRTKKNGERILITFNLERKVKRKVQRYKCKECGRTFSKRREKKKKYSFSFKVEISRKHIEERMSYRVISKRIKEEYRKRISPTQLSKMVNEVAERSKGSLQIKEEYQPKWEGYLSIDDKWINKKGKKYLSLIATDNSGDMVHNEMFEEETQSNYDSFINFVINRIGYKAKSITTDFDPMIESSILRIVGKGIPHQKCIWHGKEIIEKMIEMKKTANKYRYFKKMEKEIREGLLDKKQSRERWEHKLKEIEIELKEIEEEYKVLRLMLTEIESMLYDTSRESSDAKFRIIKRKYKNRFPEVIKFLNKNYENMVMHQRDKKIPKTNNMAENRNKQIERRLKTIESFQYFRTACNYLNLLCNYLRFKPYTDCKGKNKYRNRKSPLELCRAIIVNRDWLKNSVNWIKDE